jgi:hypothetical protein
LRRFFTLQFYEVPALEPPPGVGTLYKKVFAVDGVAFSSVAGLFAGMIRYSF